MQYLQFMLIGLLGVTLFSCQNGSKSTEKEANQGKSYQGISLLGDCCSSQNAKFQYQSLEDEVTAVSKTSSSNDDETVGIGSCKLSGSEKATRSSNFKEELYPHLRDIQEIDDGYALVFEGKKKVIQSIHQYLLGEWECCPFFTFQVDYQANHGPVSVKFKGGEQVKEMIRANYHTLLPKDSDLMPR